MLVWPMAASEPSSMEAMETSTISPAYPSSVSGSGSPVHCGPRCPNGTSSTRRIRAMAATLGAVLMKAVTGVGAPS